MKKNKKIWMDIEIREDIDDILTLVYAIENNYNIKYVSIHNPSEKELTVLKNVLNKLNINNMEIIISGKITKYQKDEDICEYLEKEYTYLPEKEYTITGLETFLNKNKIENDLTVFCGGSLYTLSRLIEKNNNIEAYIQGGYAGSNIIPDNIALKKFQKRESVPTWNLNLDITSTEKVLKNHKNILYFISKNICHKSTLSQKELNKNSYFQNMLNGYYLTKDESFRNKPLHDLLAFLAIENQNNLIEFKEVEMEHSQDKIPKWKSNLKENTNVFISVDFNYSEFKKILLKKPELKNKIEEEIEQSNS